MLDVKAMRVLLLMLMASVGCAQAQDAWQDEPATVRPSRLQEMTTGVAVVADHLARPGHLQVPVSSLPVPTNVSRYVPEGEVKTVSFIVSQALAPAAPIDGGYVTSAMPRILQSFPDLKPLYQPQPNDN